MERAQKEYLIQNLPKILPLLECSTTLLVSLSSKGLLTKEDRDVLHAKRKESSTAQTAKLFDILYTKTGAFNGLVEALTKAGATGALDVMMGFSENNETEKEESKESRFSLSPKYLHEYLQSNQSLDNIFVVYSDDPALTCERISETVPNSEFLSHQSFLKSISRHNHINGQMTTRVGVVNCGDDVLKLHHEASRVKLKFVLVAHAASEKPKNVRCWANERILWDELSAFCRHGVFEKVQNITKMSNSECWETCEKLEHAVLQQLIKGESPVLFNDTIPPCLKYYIPRHLIRRCKISNDIFKSNGPDVFLIDGIEPYQLSILVKDKHTETSSRILTNSSSFETKFIVLQSLAHVKEILPLASNFPVHHLTWDNNVLTWKFSKGSLSYIQRHIDDNEHQTVFTDEKDLYIIRTYKDL